MEHIVIASNNPVKVQATLNGFRRMFPEVEYAFSAVTVPSDISAQPLTDAETLQGAGNRARHAREQVPEADYWVGIEGGIEDWGADMAAFAWIVVLGKDPQNVVVIEGKARTGAFFVPDKIAGLVRQGKELGEADDIFFQRTNSKQGNGAIGILTGDVIDRVQLYEPAVIMALLPFKNRELYH